MDTERLNANQQRAVAWDRGPMLVLAGPGSGKTHVLTVRAARLILDSPQSRFGVLGLTFTTKAAEEMRGRVAGLLGPDAHRTRLTTFHGFATDVLRQHGSHVGLRPDFEILTQEADQHRHQVTSPVRTITSRRCSMMKSSSSQAWPASAHVTPQLLRMRKRRNPFVVPIPIATTACSPSAEPPEEITQGGAGE